MISDEEQEAWREVDAAYARLVATSHRHSNVVACRIDVERAVANLKRVIGADQPVRYTTDQLQALRAAGFTDRVIWKGRSL